MSRSGNAALPVANDILRHQILGTHLRPRLLNRVKFRRVAAMMLQQAVLQIETQKLAIATLKRAFKAARAEVDQRMQINIVIECARNTLLFKRRF